MSPEDEHFNIISGAEASTDSHYIYNRSRMKNNTLFKDNLMSLLQSSINSQLYCATCQMALAKGGIKGCKEKPKHNSLAGYTDGDERSNYKSF